MIEKWKQNLGHVLNADGPARFAKDILNTERAWDIAAELLGLTLVPARTSGYDALRGTERIQIKGRAFGKDAKPGQRMSRIKLDACCDTVLLVLLDNETLEPREMWEASFAEVAKRLLLPGSKARERGALGVHAFKRVAHKVWPDAQTR